MKKLTCEQEREIARHYEQAPKFTREQEREIASLERKKPSPSELRERKRIAARRKKRLRSGRKETLADVLKEQQAPEAPWMSVKALALTHNCSTRTIKNIFKRQRGETLSLRPFQLQELFDAVQAPFKRGEKPEDRDRRLMEEHPPWLVRCMIEGKLTVLCPRSGRYKVGAITIEYGGKRSERAAVKRARRTVLSKLERYCTERLALDNTGLPDNPRIDALWNGLSKAQQDEYEARGGAAAILGAVPYDGKER